jgi:hypothetical protein
MCNPEISPLPATLRFDLHLSRRAAMLPRHL